MRSAAIPVRAEGIETLPICLYVGADGGAADGYGEGGGR